MYISISNPVINKIINEQFKIIGESVKYEDIPESGEIKIKDGKKEKKIQWWEYYLFQNEEQYLKWKGWAIKLMKESGLEKQFDLLDMTYGLNYRLPQTQEGQLSLIM